MHPCTFDSGCLPEDVVTYSKPVFLFPHWEILLEHLLRLSFRALDDSSEGKVSVLLYLTNTNYLYVRAPETRKVTRTL